MHHTLDPQPIRTTPNNDFAHNTVTHRLPKNIRTVRELNDFHASISKALDSLADEIANNAVIPPPPFPAWDTDTWLAEWSPYEGARWHDIQWFFGETYGFRLLLERTRYFETYHDPYSPLKQREIDSGSAFLPIQRFFAPGAPPATLLGATRAGASVPNVAGAGGANRGAVGSSVPTGASVPADTAFAILEEALHISMWGNKADISFASGGELDHSAGERELLLIDHSVEAAESILDSAREGRPLHIVMDNSGAELAGDLVLAFVAVRVTGTSVVLHPKLYPTYVSDTTARDIHHYLEAAATHADDTVRRFADAVTRLIDEGSIVIAPDDYWCTTRFLLQMPPRVHRALNAGSFVVVKGDFNYRRVMRDTIWPSDTDPHAAAAVDLKVPLLLLRTMKSDCLVGVPATTTTALDASEPGWRTAGKRGVIQLLA